MWTYLISLLIIVIVFIDGIILNYIGNMLKERAKNIHDDEDKIPGCWKNINRLLHEMPEGEAIKWEKSFGIRTKEKSFHDGKKLVRFLAVLALNSATNQYNIVIYNIETKNIVQFTSSPDVNQLENLFYKFEPFEKQQMMNPMMGRNSKYARRQGLQLSVAPQDYNSEYEPSDSVADSALNKLDGNRND